jgi:hypothetical protein
MYLQFEDGCLLDCCAMLTGISCTNISEVHTASIIRVMSELHVGNQWRFLKCSSLIALMERVEAFEKLVNLYQSTWCYNQDSHLCTHCCENLKSYYLQFTSSGHCSYRLKTLCYFSQFEVPLHSYSTHKLHIILHLH